MYQPRHLAPQPTLRESLRAGITGRRGKALAGIALAVPTTVAGVGLTDAAHAAPAVGFSATANKSSGVQVLRYGDRGAAVKVLQQRLKISQDGSFGPGTLKAVKAFQGKKGLSRDGVVGPATWRALGGFPGKGANTPAKAKPKPKPAAKGSNSRAVQVASQYIGVPYRYGGSTPSGFDCSGLTSHVYKKLGKNLPRTARAQQAHAKRVSNPQPGDLVFYGAPARHVGIYAGNGMMIDAPKPGHKVSKRAIYKPQLSGYGRV